MTMDTLCTSDAAEGRQLQGGLLVVHVASLDVGVLVRVLLALVIGVFLQEARAHFVAPHVSTIPCAK